MLHQTNKKTQIMKGIGIFILATVGLSTDKIFITTLCLVGIVVLIYKMLKDDK